MPASSPAPRPSNEDSNSCTKDELVAEMAAKQRLLSNAPSEKVQPQPPQVAPRAATAPFISLARRRRLSVYIVSFAVMLLLSSVLDVRRAAVRARTAKVHLFPRLPSTSSDGSASVVAGAPDLLGLRAPHVLRDGDEEDPFARVRPALEHPAVASNLQGDARSNDGSNGSDRTEPKASVQQNFPETQNAPSPLSKPNASPLVASKDGHDPDIGPVAAPSSQGPIGQSVEQGVEIPGLAAKPGAHVALSGQPVNADPNISAQELKDEVDQLIAHVEEESSKEAETASVLITANGTNDAASGETHEAGILPTAVGNGTVSMLKPSNTSNNPHPISLPTDGTGASVTSSNAMPTSNISINSSVMLGSIAHQPPSQEANSSSPSVSESRLSAEDLFVEAQARLKEIQSHEQSRALIDENEIRVIEALSLQATRGDCEQPSASEGGSLFKSDAEAASQQDVERTEPLWGAWCLFMGTYKSDAMRDFVTKLHVLEGNLERVKADSASSSGAEIAREVPRDGNGAPGDGSPSVGVHGPQSGGNNSASAFDPFRATLGDVMSEDVQNTVVGKVHFLRSHLQENELRYLGALALQASFGSCGPYGREAGSSGSKPGKLKTVNGVLYDEKGLDMRQLTETLTGQTALRREGSLWGAWCVLEGKDRSAAGSELVDRIELLLAQLAKKQPDSQSDSGGESSAGDSVDLHPAGRVAAIPDNAEENGSQGHMG